MLSSHSSLGSTNGNGPLQPPRLMGVSNVRERVVSLSMSLPRHERLRSGSNMASSANLLGSTTSSRHLVESGEWWGVPALLERQPGPAIVKPLTGHHDVPKLSSCFVKTWSDMESAIRPPVDRHVFDGVQRRRAQLERQISRQELACHEQRLQTAKLQQSQKLERQRHVSMREQHRERDWLGASKRRDGECRPSDRARLIRRGADIAQIDEARGWYLKTPPLGAARPALTARPY
mmetsp:Transcript_7174/g.15650  ORF Transcript_7174/g.15650 Transcript_7174/m.15650 type:complete len:234 (+) Transcript_7174:332-1033(+)